ncbi:MAG: hypothetical protein GOU97_01145 [Nanoarchaeota archaeon]|nr:hypothetical protein [Nanoarchaeota archaeon]
MMIAVFSFHVYESDRATARGVTALMEVDQNISEQEEYYFTARNFAINSFLEYVNTSSSLQEVSSKVSQDLNDEFGQDFGVSLSCEQPFTRVTSQVFDSLIHYNFCSLQEAQTIYDANPPIILDCLDPEPELGQFIQARGTDFDWGFQLVLKSESEVRVNFFVYNTSDYSNFKPHYLNQGDYYTFIC